MKYKPLLTSLTMSNFGRKELRNKKIRQTMNLHTANYVVVRCLLNLNARLDGLRNIARLVNL